MLGCCKYGSNAFLELRSNNTFEESLITLIPENSVFINVTEQDCKKKAKVPRPNKFESAILDIIIEQLRKQYQDTTSVYCKEYSKENSYYFKTRGARVCPHGHTHEEDNFIVSHDVDKGLIHYVCLSSECSPQCTLLARINGAQVVEEDFIKKLGVKSDLEAAQRVFELYPHWVCCKEVLYAFDSRTGMWSENANVHHSILSDLDENLHLIT